MRKINRKKSNRKGTKRSNENVTIKRLAFLDMLRKIHLGGAVNECVVVFDNGKASSEIVDVTNNIIILADSEINHKDKSFRIASEGFTAEIGIGNIEILMKFLSSIEDEKLNIKLSPEGDSLLLSSKKGNRRMNYLTSVTDLISTRLVSHEKDEKDFRSHFLEMPEANMYITQQEAKDLTSYINLSRSKIVTIVVEEEKAIFTIGSGTEHEFMVEIELDEEAEDEFKVKTNGENFAKVLSACVFVDEDPTTIHVGPECPIVVTDNTTLWCLTPMEDTDGD